MNTQTLLPHQHIKTAFLQQMPASQKIVAACVFSIGVSLLTQPLTATLACPFAFFLLFISGLHFSYIGKRLIIVNIFFLILWILLPLSFTPQRDETPLFTFGFANIYASGYTLALLITLKGNALVSTLLALTGSSTMVENGKGLHALKVPQKLVALLLITYNNLQLMHREYFSLFQAAKLRAFTPRTTIKSYATYAKLIGLLLIRAWQRAENIEQAMRLRSFCGFFPFLTQKKETPTQTVKNISLVILCSIYALFLVFFDNFKRGIV